MTKLTLAVTLLAACLAAAIPAGAQCTAPTLVSPADNATNVPVQMTFEWSGTPAANGMFDIDYLRVGDPSFTRASSSGTTFSPPQLQPGATYKWRVLQQGCTEANASPIRTFVTASATSCPTGTATLDAPAADARFSAGDDVDFSWEPVAGAIQYDLLVASGTGPLMSVQQTTATSARSSFAEGTYRWAVKAIFAGACTPTISGQRAFKVFGATCASTGPQLIAPANNASDLANPVHFDWNPVAGATKYRLFVAVDGGTPELLTTTTDTHFDAELTGRSFRWAVEALFDSCPEVLSEQRVFTLASEPLCPANPGKASLLSPAPDAKNVASPVTFQWSPVADAKTYRLWISADGGTPTILGTSTTTSLSLPVPQGTIAWFVEARFGDSCAPTLSVRQTFTVSSGASCDHASPSIIAPTNGATGVTSPALFRWNAVAGAAGYKLYVSTDGDAFDLYGATTATELEKLVPPGAIDWYVVAVFAGCPDVRSATSHFTAAAAATCPDETVTLNAPANGATVSSPVTFSWSAVTAATVYRVWIVANDGAPVLLARTNDLQTTQSVPAGTLKWFVEAVREHCSSILSARNSFTVQSASNCGNNSAPHLIAPAGTEQQPGSATSPVNFQWDASPNAIGYRVWLARNDQPAADIAVTRDTHLERTLPSGKYSWYVEALFEGCGAMSSAKAFFTIADTTPRCIDTKPIVLGPASGSTVTSPVTFLWSAVDGAIEYRLFAKLNDSAFTLIGTTDETSLVRPVPPGTVTWYVEAVFRSCPSTESERATFSAPPSVACAAEAPQLVAPENGATNLEPLVEFAWQPVSGAVRYVLVVQAGEGSPTAIAETTETRVTHRVPPGAIKWWVIAFFNGCDAAKSAEFAFTVATPAGCETRAAVLLAPPNGAPALTGPIYFAWSPVPHARGYKVWVQRRNDEPGVIATSTAPFAKAELPPGAYEWFVETLFENCPPTESARGTFRVDEASDACAPPLATLAQAPGQVLSATPYAVRWLPLPRVSGYEIQESTTADFANATTLVVSEPVAHFTHDVASETRYLYRIRGISACSDDRGAYSDVVGTLVVPSRTTGTDRHASLDLGTQAPAVQTITLPPSNPPVAFTAIADKPWLTVTPSLGVVGPDGATLTVTSDPNALDLGTTTGTIRITYAAAGKGQTTNSTTPTSYPVSISLVTPVSPTGKGTPPPDALIFPAVAHATGINDSLFESDVRITNLAATTMKYQLNFTPSTTDGTQTGNSTTVEVAPNSTLALDDILASFFGASTTTGMLEVRPLTTSSTATKGTFSGITSSAPQPVLTVGSSRTFNSTPTGTFGQYVPAIPYAQFAAKNQIISLQQIAQSAAYRTNFGFVEGSGQPADLRIRVFDVHNQQLAEFSEALKAGEHKQINQMLALHGVTDLADGRVEVQVVSDTGKITAYASTLDNLTSDPLLVSPVQTATVNANRTIVPGVAYINNGLANWRTDMRLFNAGTTALPTTLTYYPQGNPGAALTRQIEVAAGEITVLDNVLNSMFGIADPVAGGSIAVTTSKPAPLVTTARTYNQTTSGTYGQFIPGVTTSEAVGLNDRSLNLLQLEQSTRFRTNIGLAETTGNAATVDVSVNLPDSKATPTIRVSLAANEFRQLSLADFGVTDAMYNVRATVRVTSGTGRVTGYGSVIDLTTQDPTYVPAQ
ncbi:MAG TPA: hypothetical protein VFN10_08000 [Thermoanaerobaculia bacterium]|nr:hypothetical protein [Thermoanaerobaculia bacterium]